jgi:cytochrome c oxidase subunit 1
MIGGFIMGVASLIYFIVFFATAFSKATQVPQIILPESEDLHEEKPIALLLNMKPWIIASIVMVMFTYVPALISVFKYSKPVHNKYQTQSPENMNK